VNYTFLPTAFLNGKIRNNAIKNSGSLSYLHLKLNKTLPTKKPFFVLAIIIKKF